MVIATVPLVVEATVALYVNLSPLTSVALTVPTTAPVEAFGVPRVALEITGGLLVTAAVTAAAGESI